MSIVDFPSQLNSCLYTTLQGQSPQTILRKYKLTYPLADEWMNVENIHNAVVVSCKKKREVLNFQ